MITLEEGVLQAIVSRGYSQEFGARELRRTVTDLIENYLADYLLRHQAKRGDTIVIRLSDLRL
jgi:ATP-dependent Clp protease ATP-binding subunit ClpA